MFRWVYKWHEKKKKFYEKFPFLHPIISLASIIFWVFAFKSSVLGANNIPSGSMIPTLKIGDFLFVNEMRFNLDIPFTDIPIIKMDIPKRGDIVTFTPPAMFQPDGTYRVSDELVGKTLVKRIVAVPGDTIKVVSNKIFINDVPYPLTRVKDPNELKIIDDLDYSRPKSMLDLFKEKIIDPNTGKIIREHYVLMHKNEERLDDGSFATPIQPVTYYLPAGKYFLMGDNRDNSEDSRFFGPVDIKNIHGKVFLSYFSVNWGDHKYGGNPELFPVFKLFKLLAGQKKGVYVRWDRVFKRIY
ncbi:MAG: signal peptidase I [Candidatus Hydrogenedentota bacterium]|nr:MAG: signal peptidase I [Candidatus Hydrogenedentota bacterium]